MKQKIPASYDKFTATSRGSYLMHVDELTKVFMNKIEKTRSIYTKIYGNYQRYVIIASQL